MSALPTSSRDDSRSRSSGHLLPSTPSLIESGLRGPDQRASNRTWQSVECRGAAHVPGAAPGGPRYDSTMTAQQRADNANGVRLCQTCAKLIDNDPVRFHATLLRGGGLRRQQSRPTKSAKPRRGRARRRSSKVVLGERDWFVNVPWNDLASFPDGVAPRQFGRRSGSCQVE